MPERLVDILNSHDTVLRTYPVTIENTKTAPQDAVYEAKASEAAAEGGLVPKSDLDTLTTRMHVSRGGALAPYGDDAGTPSQTRQALDQEIRERAYFLWQQHGSPADQADEFWFRAEEAGGS